MIVVLTALEVEHRAVLDRIDDVEGHEHRSGTHFDIGRTKDEARTEIALAFSGMGNLPAATLAERSVNEFRPSALMFVGVAGALRPWLHLGDVVVATRIYAYHGGRSDDTGFRSRPRSWDLTHTCDQRARVLARTARWRHEFISLDGHGEPDILFGPVAAGDVVLDSAASPTAALLRDRYNDAVAIEMESAGLASAGHLNDSVPTITVRGISDHADGEKERGDSAGWQQVAAHNAARFALALAGELDSPRDPARPAPDPDGPRHGTGTAVNRAGDHTTIGQQNGVNYGVFTMHVGQVGEHR
ncbi:nucleoside phosphorylase [Prauserella shujinwangii]|uniref:Nucleoside phosphorylase n=1 Tax=Prauserella shujinwangii TaxID=1453103 RepID=A0A2T0M2J0_9PSEU|nr:5'-methylthioadenosine/S-adenosylhomocysteine nucleosidase [Prauserella shujinwangii]PRX50958.1 nucleoside phosphorylase [Prauserella shujinwangii]